MAVRKWAVGHGLNSLAVADVLDPAELRRHAIATDAALFIAAATTPLSPARRSVVAA